MSDFQSVPEVLGVRSNGRIGCLTHEGEEYRYDRQVTDEGVFMGRVLQIVEKWTRFSTALLPVSLVILLLALWVEVPIALVYAAAVLATAWIAGVGVVTAVALGAWAAIVGIVVLGAGIWIGSILGLVIVGLGGGLVAGGVGKLLLERTARIREKRIDALPDWNRDELGEAAEHLSADFTRTQVSRVIGSREDSVVDLLDAVCRPLPGATVLAQEPAVAIYGSRVAVVGEAELPPLPRGVTVQEFTFDPLEVHSTAHDLAVHLSAGAPANGDALSGKAAHLHHLTLQALSG